MLAVGVAAAPALPVCVFTEHVFYVLRNVW
jgi:hypothetical protein